MHLERLFCFKYQTYFALQHGGMYWVTMDAEFSDVTAPYLHKEIRRYAVRVVLLCQFRGIVPITCDELFKAMAENTDKNKV